MLYESRPLQRGGTFSLTEEELLYLSHNILGEIAVLMAQSWMRQHGEAILVEMENDRDEILAEVMRKVAEVMADRIKLNIEPPKP